jgi:hypothetical protein
MGRPHKPKPTKDISDIHASDVKIVSNAFSILKFDPETLHPPNFIRISLNISRSSPSMHGILEPRPWCTKFYEDMVGHVADSGMKKFLGENN